jgi:hypothetical protein
MKRYGINKTKGAMLLRKWCHNRSRAHLALGISSARLTALKALSGGHMRTMPTLTEAFALRDNAGIPIEAWVMEI